MIYYPAGPLPNNGDYLVVYKTPGCNVLTVAAVSSSKNGAIEESRRLNSEVKRREIQTISDLVACGLARG